MDTKLKFTHSKAQLKRRLMFKNPTDNVKVSDNKFKLYLLNSFILII